MTLAVLALFVVIEFVCFVGAVSLCRAAAKQKPWSPEPYSPARCLLGKTTTLAASAPEQRKSAC